MRDYDASTMRPLVVLASPLRRPCIVPRLAHFPAVKQEVDRHEDLIRSTLRAVDAVNALPEADHSPAWKAFMDSYVLTPAMKVR